MKGGWREVLSALADLATVVGFVVMLVAGGGYAVGRLSRTSLAVVLGRLASESSGGQDLEGGGAE